MNQWRLGSAPFSWYWTANRPGQLSVLAWCWPGHHNNNENTPMTWHAVHTGSVSVTERRVQIVREIVHTHFNSAVHTGFLNPWWKSFDSKRQNHQSGIHSLRIAEAVWTASNHGNIHMTIQSGIVGPSLSFSSLMTVPRGSHFPQSFFNNKIQISNFNWQAAAELSAWSCSSSWIVRVCLMLSWNSVMYRVFCMERNVDSFCLDEKQLSEMVLTPLYLFERFEEQLPETRFFLPVWEIWGAAPSDTGSFPAPHAALWLALAPTYPSLPKRTEMPEMKNLQLSLFSDFKIRWYGNKHYEEDTGVCSAMNFPILSAGHEASRREAKHTWGTDTQRYRAFSTEIWTLSFEGTNCEKDKDIRDAHPLTVQPSALSGQTISVIKALTPRHLK